MADQLMELSMEELDELLKQTIREAKEEVPDLRSVAHQEKK